MATDAEREIPPAQRGDEDELYRRYQPLLLKIVRTRVYTSKAVIEDACSFAWLQLLRHQPSRDHIFLWLAKTAERAAIELDRRARRMLPLEWPGPYDHKDHVPELASPRDEIGQAMAYREALADVATAGLTEREALAVGLFGGGHSYHEIAELTGWSWRTVERQLQRARAKLSAVREPELPGHEAEWAQGRRVFTREPDFGIDF